MTRYRLSVSPRADHDTDVIFEWLAEHSTAGALSWFRTLRDTLRDIVQKPLSYSRAPEADLFDRDIRQALFKTRRGRMYRALFVVVENSVHVVAVRGSGQDLAAHDELELPS